MALACVTAGVMERAGAAELARAPRPNIVVVMTDDQAYGTLAEMPAVQADLVAHGTSYERFFVSFPLCCPSRATFLTGQYFHNHRVVGSYSTSSPTS
ncbi:MAG: sulfatase-like hydrolase/transferase [Solirubrobacterales bacterium]